MGAVCNGCPENGRILVKKNEAEIRDLPDTIFDANLEI